MSRIGSALGVPLYADEFTSIRISFALLLVEVDVTVPMPSSLLIEGPDGQLMKKKVEYETPLRLYET